MNKLMYMLFLICTGVLTGAAMGQVQGRAVWKYTTGGKIIGSAVVGEERVFFGSDDGVVHALRISDGRPVWTRTVDGHIASEPGYDGKSLYILSGDGCLHKLLAETGEEIWTFKTDGPENRFQRLTFSGRKFSDIWDYYLSGPVVDEGVVYFGSSDQHVYAVDTHTGKLTWKYKTGNVVHASPIVDDGVIYIGSFDGFMYALNTKDGILKWKFDTIGAASFPNGAIQKKALVHGDLLLFGSRDYNLYVLDKHSGKGYWNYKAGSWVIARPLVHGESVIFVTSDSKSVFNKDLKNHRILNWKINLPLRMFASPVAHVNSIYVGNFNGILYGLDPESGEIRWMFKTDGHKENYAAIFQPDGAFQPGFSIYGNSLKETAANDEKLMSLGSILATPVIHDKMIYFGSTDSTFYAVPVPE